MPEMENNLPIKLSDLFDNSQIVRDISFSSTYSPFYEQKESIGYAESEHLIKKLNSDKHVAGIITLNHLSKYVSSNKGIIISENPQKTYYSLHNMLVEDGYFYPLHESFVGNKVEIADSAIIMNNVYIGDNVKIGHGVIIHENCYIGAGTIIEDYAVIGVMGMQNTIVDGKIFEVKYSGGVKIGKNCQILSQAIVQKPYQRYYTEIGDNVQISVKVVVGHGSQIGEQTKIAGNCQLSGNVRIGKNVLIGPSVTLSDGINVGNSVNIKLGSVVVTNVTTKEVVSGNFALSHRKHLREFSKISRSRR